MNLLPIISFAICYKLANWIFNKKTKIEADDIITIIYDCPDDYIDFIAIDVETTGLEWELCDIIEVSAIKYSNGEIVSYLSTLIDPGKEIPEKITELTGIENKDVRGKPSMEDILPILSDYIGDRDLLGHHVEFDINFIDKYFDSSRLAINDRIDTLSLSRILFPSLKSRRLTSVAEHLNIKIHKFHRSLEDARAAAEIYLYYLSNLKKKQDELVRDFSEQELLIYNFIFESIRNEGLSPSRFLVSRTSSYLDFSYILEAEVEYCDFLRFKLDGLIQYLLVDLAFEDFNKIFPNTYNIEEPNLAEGDRTRLMLNCKRDLESLGPVLSRQFKILKKKRGCFKKKSP